MAQVTVAPYLYVALVQFQCLVGIVERQAIALRLDVGKAAIAVVGGHVGVEVNGLGVILYGHLELLGCESNGI